MEQKRVAIFSTFYTIDPSYSLNNVVEDQISMFVNNGYSIVFLADEAFEPKGIYAHPMVILRKLPKAQRDNYGNLNNDWKMETGRMYEALKVHLADIDVVLAHDITLQCAHIVFNIASRRLAIERPDLLWIHWCHSATSPSIHCNIPEASELIKPKFPNSVVAYPNDWDRPRVARNYHYELDEVFCVHHPTDLAEYFGFHELTRQLIKEKDLYSADVINVYPCRLDRGKQVEYNIRMMASVKRTGRDMRLIIMDFSSTGDDKLAYRETFYKRHGDGGLVELAKSWGLEEKEITFTSMWKPETNYSCPRQMVKDLFLLSNIYIHPSTSETYSLVTQEAILCKNFCILNHHFPPMRSIYGDKNVLYEPFGSAVDALSGDNGSTQLNIHDEEKHFLNLANKINYFIENNPVLAEHTFIRKFRNPDYVFKHEIEPLINRTKL